MESVQRPRVELLSQSLLERIVAQALEVLWKAGVLIDNEGVLEMLGDSGARIDGQLRKAFIPEALVWSCLRLAPSGFDIFGWEGSGALHIGGLEPHFDPGSAALRILDSQSGAARPPATSDLVSLARLTDALPHIGAQSTALVPTDVPAEIADRYRLLIVLLNSTKPVVTGTFVADGFPVMKQMLVAAGGDEQTLRKHPRAIFDVCSTQPLRWSRLTSQCLVECASSGIPAELISAPLLGATAPVTLTGALVQHTAENLSGVVIHQLAAAGSPLVYGGSPAVFDMRHGTIALGAIESAMVTCAYAQIGRFFHLPTHGYLGLSDSKMLDVQCGLESGIGATLAALAGINVVSGAGMLEFENCQSLEKLVIDNEICGMARRLIRGIEVREEPMGRDLFADISDGDHFLTSPVTLQWLRDEIFHPGNVINRESPDVWQKNGSKDALLGARERVRDLLETHQPKPLPADLERHLIEIVQTDARQKGLVLEI
ncbi:MAG TPA: trimethylamine methyltransferase family protein [Acidobacteriota bacterium]|nr:trimethylamine methyltransferase family protein [Acidobacteriota bacterium]